MLPRSEIVTPSRFRRRLPGGRHDLLFKVVFHSDAAAARSLRVSKMSIWRWRHDRAPLPDWVAVIMTDLIQIKVEEAHQAQDQLRYYRAEPPRPPRPLSGCCAGRARNIPWR
jgi:hypothetical protein